MTEIYLIRHAEAEGNVYRRIHGHYDGLLTPMGLQQVAALEQRMANVHIDACFSSDLTRACMTAQAICRPRGMALHRCPEFREVGLGRWEDLPFGVLDNFEPEEMARYGADPVHWSIEGCETYPVYTGRFVHMLEELARTYDGKTIAVFSHSCVMRGVLMRLFFDDDVSKTGFCDNTAVSLLRYEAGSFRPVYLNDNSHLSGALSTQARQKWWKSRPRADFNLWFQPARGQHDLLLQLYREAWCRLYGSDQAFDEQAVTLQARKEEAIDEQRLVHAMLREQPVGVILLRDCAEPDIGWITFLALAECKRGLGMGAQLLGHAVSYFRRAGRSRVCLAVSRRNEQARAFYRKCGFREVGALPGAAEPLLVLELNIDQAKADVPPEAN